MTKAEFKWWLFFHLVSHPLRIILSWMQKLYRVVDNYDNKLWFAKVRDPKRKLPSEGKK